jgi:hypothetical protein
MAPKKAAATIITNISSAKELVPRISSSEL